MRPNIVHAVLVREWIDRLAAVYLMLPAVAYAAVFSWTCACAIVVAGVFCWKPRRVYQLKLNMWITFIHLAKLTIAFLLYMHCQSACTDPTICCYTFALLCALITALGRFPCLVFSAYRHHFERCAARITPCPPQQLRAQHTCVQVHNVGKESDLRIRLGLFDATVEDHTTTECQRSEVLVVGLHNHPLKNTVYHEASGYFISVGDDTEFRARRLHAQHNRSMGISAFYSVAVLEVGVTWIAAVVHTFAHIGTRPAYSVGTTLEVWPWQAPYKLPITSPPCLVTIPLADVFMYVCVRQSPQGGRHTHT